VTCPYKEEESKVKGRNIDPSYMYITCTKYNVCLVVEYFFSKTFSFSLSIAERSLEIYFLHKIVRLVFQAVSYENR